MRKIEIKICDDRTYARLLALEAAGIFDRQDYLSTRINEIHNMLTETKEEGWERYTFKVLHNIPIERCIETTEEQRQDYKKELEKQIKRLPPYWYTDEETIQWEKEYDRKANNLCIVCGNSIMQAKRGKIKRYCSNKCKQADYRERKNKVL